MKLESGLGFIAAFALLIGGALAFQLPRAAAIVLALGGLVAIAGSDKYHDLFIWGIAMLVLATVAFAVGLRRKRPANAEPQSP